MRMSIKHLFVISLILVSFTTYGQKNRKEFEPKTETAEIEIKIKGGSAGITKLGSCYGNQRVLKDSAIADSTGKVVFKSSLPYPPGLYFVVYSNNVNVTFLLDKNQKFFLYADKDDFANTMKTNSAENLLYYNNFKYETGLTKRIDSLNNKIAAAKDGSKEYLKLKDAHKKLIQEKRDTVNGYVKKYPGSFFAAFKYMGQNPILQEPKKPNGELDSALQLQLYRNQFWDNYDFNDERMVRTPVFYNKLNTYLTNLFPQRVDSIMKGVRFIMEKVDKGDTLLFNFTLNYLALFYKESTVMGGEKIFCYVVDNYLTLKKAYWADSVTIVRIRAQSDLRRPSLLGEIGQDLNCKNEKGEYVSLYSIKKPIRIVYLYNPDCEHCIKETPDLMKLYAEWKSKGLEIYAVDVEREYDKWHDFIKKFHLDCINIIDPDRESHFDLKYYIENTPGLYVLDSNNKIVAKRLLPDQLPIIFEMMLK